MTTTRTARQTVETMKYLGAAKRFIAAAGRRVATADEPELLELTSLRASVEDAIVTAVEGMRERGLSWADIGAALGTSKQAAQKRYSPAKEA
jgi:hypothetical protein